MPREESRAGGIEEISVPTPTRGSEKPFWGQILSPQPPPKQQKHFLGFEDPNSPQKRSWFHRGCAFCREVEELYPIHVAAKLGKPQMVKVLLRAGADKEKNTSQGRLRNGGPCNRKKDLVL